jgi:hypothetical protein
MRSRVLSLVFGWCISAAVPAAVHAQSGAVAVTGVVYDSVSRMPLVGAVVQVALVDSVAAPRVYSGVTGARGLYRIDGLPHGRYAIGFQHEALNALGLESPLRAFQVFVDTTLAIDLAVPSGPVVRSMQCDSAASVTGDGLLAGYVIDGRRNAPLPGAVVEIRWSEVALDKGRLMKVQRRRTATAAEDGMYLACGVGTEEGVTIRVAAPGFWPLADDIVIPAGGTLRQDFRLAIDSIARGVSTLDGRVVRQDGLPLASGRARIAALGVEVPITDGLFSMTELPAGTWTLDARAIGYEPRSAAVEIPERGVATATITMGQRVQMLDTMAVVARRTQNSKIIDDLLERRRVAAGTSFLPGNSWLATAIFPADVLRAARGFNYKSPTQVSARGCGGGDTIQMGGQSKPKSLAVYIDGARAPLGLEQVRTSVQMQDILAVEAYPDVISAPFLWRTNDACAVIAFWTKH